MIVACSPTPPGGGGSQSRTISPAGGALQATAADGIRYTLTFPAGAVDEPTNVTITAVDTPAAVGGFRVEPAGLVLNIAATLEMDLPAGVTAPPTTTFALGSANDPTFVATTVEGSRLSAGLRYFAVPARGWSEGPATQGAAHVASQPGAGLHGELGASTALAPQQEDGDTVRALEADCSRRLDAMRAAFDQLVASDSFEAAMKIVNDAGALAMLCGDDAEVAAWEAEVVDVVCARYEELVLNAEVVAADTFNVFTEISMLVMSWWETMQKLGVDCEAAKPPSQVMGEKIGQFITFYTATVQGLTFTADNDKLLVEARKVADLHGAASLLGLPEAEALLEQQVLHPIMDLLRERGFDECVAQADHFYLYSILTKPFRAVRVVVGTPAKLDDARLAPLNARATFSDADLLADIQYCASQLTLAVWADPDVPVELTDKRLELGPGSSAGERTSEASTSGPVEGHLVLHGPIEQLLCGKERTPVAHELVVRFGTTEVHRGSSLAANPEIDIAASLSAAGLDITGLNDVDVTVVRETAEAPCGTLYGEGTEYELFTVTYTADPAPQATGVSVTPTIITADQDTESTFQLPWSDPGKNLKTLHVSYDLAGSVRTEQVDLATSTAVSGFAEGSGTGTYTQALYVGCTEKGNSPIVVTLVLEDEYGQRSAERRASVAVAYGSCPTGAGSGFVVGSGQGTN